MADVIVRDVMLDEARREGGKVDLALFNVELPGVYFRGCRLQISQHGDVVAYPPSHRRSGVGTPGAHVTSPEWRREMTRQALEQYHAAGGRLAIGLPIYPSTPSAKAY